MNTTRDYLKRSGKEQLGFGWKEENESGFCVWRVEDETTLVIVDLYGDGPFWDTWMTEKAKKLECVKIQITTKRNPHGISKKYGFEVTDYIMEKAVET